MPKPATKAEKLHLARVATLGCIIGQGCCGRITLHHTGTYMGGGKNHMKVLPLCWEHHLGREGIDGKAMSKRQWEEKYATEEVLLAKIAELLTML